MKAIMISIQPQWVEKILNGEKTIEIRKTMPKCELPCKVYLYCTKENKKNRTLWKAWNYYYCDDRNHNAFDKVLNGKVVAEFMLKQVDLLEYRHLGISHTNAYIPVNKDADYEWEKHCCVDYDYILKYGRFAPLYAWHIDGLKVYDGPKELGEFRATPDCFNTKNIEFKENAFGEFVPQYHDNSFCKVCKYYDGDWGDCKKTFKQLTRPPQSWCYVEEV